ncbi:type I restriction modification DNA specificity domain protein [Francisella philomiragia]|uniref:restriction endonuclease subunit S n=1 Tax=Francisella philomiragia TaxID=28110 RepID=UPI0005A577A2|nr:restriction endonuclease subunit S [Francisella philomiragia]AJI55921.1 type I restriction modification DNA specificity domain protein [Francisella philomiragia]MBK2252669.1 restriction endonuclease subunit S [Francisella philomiragia]
MRSNYKKLGSYIQQLSIKNKDLEVSNLLGVSITKEFIPSIANIVGTDMSKYKIVQKGQFAYGPVTSRNGDKISVALLEDENAIVSTSYTVFEIIDENELLPEYLMMWFRREEFDRYARYMSHGSTREVFGWDEMCDVELPIPSIDKQREIVAEYYAITNRIKLNEQLNQRLEETAQAIYKEWFVDFEFPCLPENYKFSGADKPNDFNSIMTYKRVGGLPVPSDKSWFVYVLLCQPSSNDEEENYTFYKGITNDLYRRFYEHYKGVGAKYTKVHKPIKVIHWEEFDSQEEAAKREKELKSGYGRTWLQRQWTKYNSGLSALECKIKNGSGLPAPKHQLRMAGEMVWCEELEKEIPKGWDSKSVYSIASFINGASFKSEQFSSDNIGLPIIKIAELKKGITDQTNFTKEIQKDKYEIDNGSILYSWSGTPDTSLEVFKWYRGKAWLNQHIFKIEVSKYQNKYFVYYTLRNLKTTLVKLAEGKQTTGLGHITVSDLKELQLAYPNNDYMEQLTKALSAIYNFHSSLTIQIIKMSSLKEILLSKMATVEE